MRTNNTTNDAASNQQHDAASKAFSRKLHARSKRLQKSKGTIREPKATRKRRRPPQYIRRRNRQIQNGELQEEQEQELSVRRSQRISAKAQPVIPDISTEIIASESDEDVDMDNSESSFFETDSASSASEAEGSFTDDDADATIADRATEADEGMTTTTGKRKEQEEELKEEGVSLETTKAKRRRLRAPKITSVSLSTSTETLVIENNMAESTATPVILGDKNDTKAQRRVRFKKSMGNTKKLEKLARHTKDELDLSSHSFLPETSITTAEAEETEEVKTGQTSVQKGYTENGGSHAQDTSTTEDMRESNDSTECQHMDIVNPDNAGQSEPVHMKDSLALEQTEGPEHVDNTEAQTENSQSSGFWNSIFGLFGRSSSTVLDENHSAKASDSDADMDIDTNLNGGQTEEETAEELNVATKVETNGDMEYGHVEETQRTPKSTWSLFSWVFARSSSQNTETSRNCGIVDKRT
ncbi:hypothetical protein EC973_003928 [Apophysomyces ossiformis]|uniref:Uncharacterized protein n=1 Tax=Apophysomyces ossiformis TaxID=679940 RepID=A0A8H7EQ93_9FUNG|nr:hypothetical protein EC973_003928 [Apophysomyces ossiformis]